MQFLLQCSISVTEHPLLINSNFYLFYYLLMCYLLLLLTQNLYPLIQFMNIWNDFLTWMKTHYLNLSLDTSTNKELSWIINTFF